MKTCSKCNIEKSLDLFSKDKSRKDGYNTFCKECGKLISKNFKENNPKYHNDWYQSNKSEVLEKSKQYNKENYTERKMYFDEWRKNNTDKIKQYRKNSKEPQHIVRWRNLIHNTLYNLGKKKEESTHKLLGYSALELKEHLDKIDKDWMNKEIDHKIPISWFKSSTPPSIINDLRNLDVLSKLDNQKKLNKFVGKVEESYYNMCKQYIKEKYGF